ncbi:CAMSAP CH domain [Parelaphostrongylus tenuis]|uniref:CAMSAP CH domain n=1 Tax=Parelaphostrongylus tenuis TaxID=148309 RepID=A0AAD5RDW4_PARTN|nr:CAMSAP CH domain [Parelaphostrongylus tenuis]
MSRSPTAPSPCCVCFSSTTNEEEQAQKHTFTKWINLHLEEHSSSGRVNDLFEDIKDGVLLCHLIEVLTGEALSFISLWFSLSLSVESNVPRWNEHHLTEEPDSASSLETSAPYCKSNFGINSSTTKRSRTGETTMPLISQMVILELCWA